MRRITSNMLTVLMGLAIAWSAALSWFLQTLPSTNMPYSLKTDGIIVLTGGNGRIERGLEALSNDAAPVLFISGVGQRVTLPQMLAAHATNEERARIIGRHLEIVLGHAADSTQSNATEAAQFISARGLHSIRLVTAGYHMRRSLLEFTAAIPGITIIPDPVFPEDFRQSDWWRAPTPRRILFTEFHKYLGAVLLHNMQ